MILITILLFLLILSLLVFVHELGHFLAAKGSGVRVDEFGLGYPPRAKKLFTWKGTLFSLNWLPFGGFVKIFGEEAQENTDAIPADSFQGKNRGVQATVLVAGVLGNILLAWLLISIGLMTGLAAPTGTSFNVKNAHTTVTTVLPGSPAAKAGIKSGDQIISVSRGPVSPVDSPEAIANFIAESTQPIEFDLKRGSEPLKITVTPSEHVVSGKPAIGISMDYVGVVKLPFFSSLYQGARVTGRLTVETAKALGQFLYQAVRGKANLAAVTGPVGLVSLVGDARQLGFSYILTFTALISINLAIINLLPFPALDGGRLLFVGIEAIRRKAISPRVFNAVNNLGFALLIFLMILVTIHDVRNIL